MKSIPEFWHHKFSADINQIIEKIFFKKIKFHSNFFFEKKKKKERKTVLNYSRQMVQQLSFRLSSLSLRNALRENCPNTVFFLVRIFPHSDWIQRDTEYLFAFSPNAGKYGSEKTPHLDNFHAVMMKATIDNNSNCVYFSKSFQVMVYIIFLYFLVMDLTADVFFEVLFQKTS